MAVRTRIGGRQSIRSRIPGPGLATGDVSISLFHNVYDRLRSVEPATGGGVVLGNKMEGTGDGLEAWGSYQPARNWRLSAGAFFLKQRLRRSRTARIPT